MDTKNTITEEMLMDKAMKVMREIKRIADMPEYDFDHSTQRREMQVDVIAKAIAQAPDLLAKVSEQEKEIERLEGLITSTPLSLRNINYQQAKQIEQLRNQLEGVSEQSQRIQALTEQVERWEVTAKEERDLNKLLGERIAKQLAELSHLREERKELVEALRGTMKFAESYMTYAYDLEQVQSVIGKAQSLLSKFEVPNQS